MKILLTGAAGFLGHYLIAELTACGHSVIGVDDCSRYGVRDMSPYNPARFTFVRADVTDPTAFSPLLADIDVLIAAAASVGGVEYFHAAPYTLFADNLRINAATLQAAIHAHRRRPLQRYLLFSTSMVYETATQFPTPETASGTIPPPRTTYGMEKLAAEYALRAAAAECALPYTIVRPHNAIGVHPALHAANPPARQHVIPALMHKILRGDHPVALLGGGTQVRCFTAAADIARGVRLALETPHARNAVFNLASAAPHTVRAVAERLWNRLRPGDPYAFTAAPGLPLDVAYSHPDISKAASVLGFTADTPLDTVLDEYLAYLRTTQ